MSTDSMTKVNEAAPAAPIVVVADDDVVHRLLMRESLEAMGMVVHEAGDGLDALNLLDELHPDLMFLDAMMPRVDGFAACVETRKRPHGVHVPVLMVTGLDDVASIDRAYQAGATDFLTKPINWPLLNHRTRFLMRFGRIQRDLRDAMERAEAASRAKTEFLATMSHELRTPLNAIIGFSEVLKRELLGPLGQERYREYAKDINESGAHLLNLISDILEYSKSECGKLRLVESEMDLGSIVAGVLRQTAPRAEAAGVTVQREGTEHAIRIHADERKLRQVMLNLMSNAIKFTPMGGEVRVGITRNDGGDVLIRVSDTGIGIAPEDLPKVYSAFGQVDNAWTRHHEGTGLGIPLAKAMIELHGGALNIKSDLGVGTTVEVKLPRERVLRGNLRLAAVAG
ncbi:MAG: ATP-binding response regulator [Dongiaceae bacterium]